MRLTGGDPSLLRRINSAVVLHALRGSQPLTLTELTQRTGLSRPTVEGVVEGLMESGLVVEAPAGPCLARRQGRPARRFRFHAEAGHLLGVEIGAHRIRVVLADLGGRVLGSHFHAVDETADADERLERVRGDGRGAAAPGGGRAQHAVGGRGRQPRHRGGGRPGAAGDGAAGLDGPAARGAAARSFHCPVLVENDANAAAVAEHWKGAAQGSDDIVFVLAGLSPGAGSLIGGRLHRGFGGAAGEIGALHLLGREVDSGAAAVHHGRAAASAGRARGGPGVRAGAGGRRAGLRGRASASSSGWCTMWRRWCWRSIRSWW